MDADASLLGSGDLGTFSGQPRAGSNGTGGKKRLAVLLAAGLAVAAGIVVAVRVAKGARCLPPAATAGQSRRPLPGVPLGSATLYGGIAQTTSVELAQAGQELIRQLDADTGVFHANRTIWTSNASSLHLFAANRTEPCHFHPGTTLATTLAGHGAFRVPYGSPQLQGPGDSFFIPTGEPHAFGPAQPGSGPVLVSVLWTPPYHPGYTIPAPGCRMKHDEVFTALMRTAAGPGLCCTHCDEARKGRCKNHCNTTKSRAACDECGRKTGKRWCPTDPPPPAPSPPPASAVSFPADKLRLVGRWYPAAAAAAGAVGRTAWGGSFTFRFSNSTFATATITVSRARRRPTPHHAGGHSPSLIFSGCVAI